MTLERVVQELQETNSAIVEVQQNTDLTANFLDLTVDIFSERLDNLFEVLRRDVDVTANAAARQLAGDQDLFSRLGDVFTSKIDDLIKFMRGVQKEESAQDLDRLETRREAASEVEDTGVKVDDDNYIKDLVKKISDFFEDVGEILGISLGIAAAPFVVIGSFFTELAVMTSKLDDLMRGGLSRFFSPITRFFNAVRNSRVITGLVNTWTNSILPFFRRMGQFFGLIDEAGKATGAFGKIIRTAAKVGTVLAKFGVVTTALIAAFEFVTGFMEGFSRGGFIEGLKQGVVDAFDAIIGSLIRLVTDIPGFILSFVGLENFGGAVSRLGDSLANAIIQTFESTVDILVGLFTLDFDKVKSASTAGGDAIVNFIVSTIDVVWGLIQDIFSFGGVELPNIGEMGDRVKTFFSELLRGILPDPSKDYKITDPRKYIAMAIPDSVYEFAGVNPETGEMIEQDTASGASVQAGTALQMEGEARRDAELERQAQQGGGTAGGGGVNVATNVQNNSNTTTQARPPAASQPDNMSDTMMTYGFAP